MQDIFSHHWIPFMGQVRGPYTPKPTPWTHTPECEFNLGEKNYKLYVFTLVAVVLCCNLYEDLKQLTWNIHKNRTKPLQCRLKVLCVIHCANSPDRHAVQSIHLSSCPMLSSPQWLAWQGTTIWLIFTSEGLRCCPSSSSWRLCRFSLWWDSDAILICWRSQQLTANNIQC